MNIPLDDFYAILRDCVKYYPDSGTDCLTLRGFRVLQLDGAIELTSDNMGATYCDAKRPYFYSKAWEKTGRNANKVIGSLPVLSVFERQGTVKNPYDKQPTIDHEILLTVWDKYNQDKCSGKCAGCEARTINEIFRDTKALLISALYYISEVVLATTDIDPSQRFYHKEMLEKMKTDAVISTYQIVGYLKNTLSIKDKTYPMYRQEMKGDHLYGTAIQITIRSTDCTLTEFDFSKVDAKAIAQEAGCKNC